MRKKKEKVVGELIFGVHPVVEALKARRRKIVRIYTTKPVPKGWKSVEQHIAKMRTAVPIQYVSRSVLTRMVDTVDHQGIVAWVGDFPLRKKQFDPKKQPFLVLLDGIQDPRNIGAIMRSAYCACADGVIMTQKGASPLTATALKSSAGLAEHLEVMVTTSIIDTVTALKESGYTIYLSTFDGQRATDIAYKKPLCIVIGSEATGISRSLYRHGTKVTLPQRSYDISYNASVAAGILLFIAAEKMGILD